MLKINQTQKTNNVSTSITINWLNLTKTENSKRDGYAAFVLVSILLSYTGTVGKRRIFYSLVFVNISDTHNSIFVEKKVSAGQK